MKTREEFIRDYAAGRLKDTDGVVSWKEATEEAQLFLLQFRADVLAEARDELKRELLSLARSYDEKRDFAAGDALAKSAKVASTVLDKHGSLDYPLPD